MADSPYAQPDFFDEKPRTYVYGWTGDYTITTYKLFWKTGYYGVRVQGPNYHSDTQSFFFRFNAKRSGFKIAKEHEEECIYGRVREGVIATCRDIDELRSRSRPMPPVTARKIGLPIPSILKRRRRKFN